MKSYWFNLFILASLSFCFSCSQKYISHEDLIKKNLTEQIEYIKNSKNFHSQKQQLQALFFIFAAWQKKSSPTSATYLGDSRYNHLWDDFSPAGQQKVLDELKQFYDLKNHFDSEKVNEEEKLNLRMFQEVVKRWFDLYGEYKEQYFMVDQIQGVHQAIPSIMAMMPKQSPKDLENLLARLKGVAKCYKDIRSTLQEGIEKGITMPKNTVILVPDQVQELIGNTPEESVFFAPFQKFSSEHYPKGKSETLKEVKKIIKEQVQPELLLFKSFLEEKYLPHCRTSFGLSNLPKGNEWYSQRIKYFTTTTLDAKEIHELGKKEVARINAQMQEIIKKLNFKRGQEAFNRFLRTSPQFYFKTPEDLLKEYRDICKRIDPMLPKLFGTLPQLPYGVVPVPEYSQKSATTAYYYPGSMESGVPGYFFANTYNLKSRPKWEMEALSIHEAVPGHHLQIALSKELKNIPEFRKMIFFTAFVEGWGLYSESLGEELGMYKDLYSKYGQLTYEMWRAIRLVVDTGIHSFGWSREEAIAYFKKNSGKTEHDIAVEVDRYIAWPGQALAYKIGELKIQELKSNAQKTLKDRFDIRQFHDVVLGNGSVPLQILEEQVNQWVEDLNKQ